MGLKMTPIPMEKIPTNYFTTVDIYHNWCNILKNNCTNILSDFQSIVHGVPFRIFIFQ